MVGEASRDERRLKEWVREVGRLIFFFDFLFYRFSGLPP